MSKSLIKNINFHVCSLVSAGQLKCKYGKKYTEFKRDMKNPIIMIIIIILRSV